MASSSRGRFDIYCASAFSYTSDQTFDYIHVGAAADRIPTNLVRMLRDNGRMLVYVNASLLSLSPTRSPRSPPHPLALSTGPWDPHEGSQEMSVVTKRGLYLGGRRAVVCQVRPAGR